MAFAHPFDRVTARSTRTTRRPDPVPVPGTAALVPVGSAGAGTTAPAGPLAPADGMPSGSAAIPRHLVLGSDGRPRRSVLLAAIMIRRGRSVDEIVSATGLPAGVVETLTRTA